jgi:biopolymer transport protein TolR
MKQDQNIVLPKRKRDPSEGELDITPMIDIVFLLLAFFVVVSRLDPQAAVPLPLASHADSISEKSSVMFIVVDDGGKETVIYKGRTMEAGALVQDGEPSAQEQEIGDYIERELSAHPSKDAILVKAAGDIRLRYIELIKRGVDKSELAKSKKIYFGVKEED